MHSGGTLSGGTYEHRALDPQVDELPPLLDEVIYRIAAILHHQSEEESVSKAESLDAMNTGHLTSVCPEILGAAWAAS